MPAVDVEQIGSEQGSVCSYGLLANVREIRETTAHVVLTMASITILAGISSPRFFLRPYRWIGVVHAAG